MRSATPLYLIIVILFASFLEPEKKKTDLFKIGLKGNVKELRFETYKAEYSNGIVLLGDRSNYESDNYSLKFNERGYRSEKTVFKYGNVLRKSVFSYDTNDDLTEQNTYTPGGELDYKIIYSYDKKGNCVEEGTYDAKGNYEAKTTYDYNKKGQKISIIEYDPDKKMEYKNTFEYNDKGENDKEKRYRSDGTLVCIFTYKYDEKGNRIEEKMFKDDSLEYTSTFKFDENGKTIEYDYVCNGRPALDNRHTYTYNENGDLIEKNVFYKEKYLDGKDTTIYKYDKFNNWIKKTEYIHSTPRFIIFREIKYY